MSASSLAGAFQSQTGLPASRTSSLMAAMAMLPCSWPKTDAAEHDFLAELVRFRLDHQHGGFGTGDDQVHLRLGHLRLRRVEDVLAADVADARGADRAVERNAGDGQGGAGADQRRDVRQRFQD